VGAVPATASVTLGQLNPTPAGVQTGFDFAQLSVASGNSYAVPANGTIISWSTNASATVTQSATFKVFRKVADPSFYKVVGLDTRPIAPGFLNTFTGLSIPVQSGDLIGAHPTGAAIAFSATAGDKILNAPIDLKVSDAGASFNTTDLNKLDLTAVFAPTNTVTLGKTALNKKKGTATLNLTLPNPGDLTASGKGVKASSAGHAVVSKSVGAGPATLVIKAKGKQKQTLDATGKVTLKVAVKYTPTNGDPGTQSVKVKLKKTG
jgi:hypothetical protein